MNRQLCPLKCTHKRCCDNEYNNQPAIGKSVFVEFTPTPYEMAEMFWRELSDYQAVFFNELGRIAGDSLVFQLQYVTDEEKLNPVGRAAMQRIGEYSAKVPAQPYE